MVFQMQKEEMKTVRGIVKGRVQGVAYRAYARSAASHFGVVGWVKNLSGGEVEFLAQAEDAALSSFIRALYRGSPLSSVREIDFEEAKAIKEYNKFEIIYS